MIDFFFFRPDHNELLREFQTIQNRLKSALKFEIKKPKKTSIRFRFFFSGEDIGVYHREDFLRDISQLQERLNQRRQLIETQSFTVRKKNRNFDRVQFETFDSENRFQRSVDAKPFPSKRFLANYGSRIILEKIR